jgi:hypothetical protein
MRRLAIALVHHPVLDRAGATVTTAITNLDLHDMARSARTYGATDLFCVHPVEAQRLLAERIREHWVEGSGKKRIPDRAIAMDLLRVVDSLEDVHAALGGRSAIEVWTTAARGADTSTFAEARDRIDAEGPPVLLVFGTGWGLAPHVISDANLRLEPIRARTPSGFNHLSVRAACAIALDRLRG